MAVCVCDADGRQSEPERRFLLELRMMLQLDPDQTAAFESEAEALIDLTEAAAPAALMGGLPLASGPMTVPQSRPPEAELDL